MHAVCAKDAKLSLLESEVRPEVGSCRCKEYQASDEYSPSSGIAHVGHILLHMPIMPLSPSGTVGTAGTADLRDMSGAVGACTAILLTALAARAGATVHWPIWIVPLRAIDCKTLYPLPMAQVA